MILDDKRDGIYDREFMLSGIVSGGYQNIDTIAQSWYVIDDPMLDLDFLPDIKASLFQTCLDTLGSHVRGQLSASTADVNVFLLHAITSFHYF